MKSIDEVLDAAADLYVNGERVWIQGHADDGNGGACMSHVVYIASDLYQVRRPTLQQIGEFATLRNYMDMKLGMLVPHWNDADDRTEVEVIDKLRELAKQYREETQV